MKTKISKETLTATQARTEAARINVECSECFSDAKAVKQFGKWVIKINGGRESCYGRTAETMGDVESLISTFKNDTISKL